MLNFEEELEKFAPSKELEGLDAWVNERNIKDAADVLLEILDATMPEGTR